MDINLERNLDQNISIDIIYINEEEAPPGKFECIK